MSRSAMPVPAGLQAFVDATNRGDSEAFVAAITEDAVLDEWSTDVRRAQRAALEHVARLPAVPSSNEAVIGRGTEWETALQAVDWADGDLLAVGSSVEGPLARVFIGSRSSKIVRHSPVPVIVVPRGAAVALAERAERP